MRRFLRATLLLAWLSWLAVKAAARSLGGGFHDAVSALGRVSPMRVYGVAVGIQIAAYLVSAAMWQSGINQRLAADFVRLEARSELADARLNLLQARLDWLMRQSARPDPDAVTESRER